MDDFIRRPAPPRPMQGQTPTPRPAFQQPAAPAGQQFAVPVRRVEPARPIQPNPVNQARPIAVQGPGQPVMRPAAPQPMARPMAPSPTAAQQQPRPTFSPQAPVANPPRPVINQAGIPTQPAARPMAPQGQPQPSQQAPLNQPSRQAILPQPVHTAHNAPAPAQPQTVNGYQAPAGQALTAAPVKSKKSLKKKLILGGAALLLISIALVANAYAHRKPGTFFQPNPIPPSVVSTVDYPIYYPEPKKLPKGFKLMSTTFNNPAKNGLVYNVSYGVSKRVVFTLKRASNQDEVDTFLKNFIPKATSYQTPIGEAKYGQYQKQKLVSIDIKDGPWLVITSSDDLTDAQLKQILSSLKKNQ